MRDFKAPPVTVGAQVEIDRARAWLTTSELPLYAEVGCGAGFHPLHFVRENTDARIIAFERTTLKFEKAKHRLESHLAKSNLYERCLIVHADATHVWSDLISPQSLAGLFFLYPNPYPKKQHANRRLAGMPFFPTSLESLKSNGRLVFATNERSYYEELRTFLAQSTQLEIEILGSVPKDLKPRSHFEKKYLERGEACYQIIAHKI